MRIGVVNSPLVVRDIAGESAHESFPRTMGWRNRKVGCDLLLVLRHAHVQLSNLSAHRCELLLGLRACSTYLFLVCLTLRDKLIGQVAHALLQLVYPVRLAGVLVALGF